MSFETSVSQYSVYNQWYPLHISYYIAVANSIPPNRFKFKAVNLTPTQHSLRKQALCLCYIALMFVIIIVIIVYIIHVLLFVLLYYMVVLSCFRTFS